MTISTRQMTTEYSPLRVFPGLAENESLTAEVNQQLPFLSPLCRQFQAVTGWELDFRPEHSSRHSPKQVQLQGDTVFGQLSITDMAAELPLGRVACHRQHCDKFVKTLDEMVAIIQDDRRTIQQSTTYLAPLVDVPLSWWSMAGFAGYCRGQIASWAITGHENIRLMAGRIVGHCPISQTIGATSSLATFDALAHSDLPLKQSIQLSIDAAERAQAGHAELEWLAGIELDGVTGDFEIAGHHTAEGMILVDVDAQTAMEVTDVGGTLTAGHVLVLGDCVKANVVQINQAIQERELTSSGVADLIESLFGEMPILMIFRN